jgi:ribosomal protein S18 acetylase RimI-like enzyme
MEATIREMRIEDYAAVRAVWTASGLPLGVSDDADGVARVLARNEGLCLVAEVQGQIVGAVLATYDGRRAWVYHLAVAEAHRGRGLGKALMERVDAGFRERDVVQANLFVLEEDAGVVPFYERLGWRVRTGAIGMSKRYREPAAAEDARCACC